MDILSIGIIKSCLLELILVDRSEGERGRRARERVSEGDRHRDGERESSDVCTMR